MLSRTFALMFRVLRWQLVSAVTVVAVLALTGHGWAAVSAAAGGACCVLPNAWFALRLRLNAKAAGGASPAVVLTGEVQKIAVTIVLLIACAMLMKGLNWWAFLAAFVLALKVPLIVVMLAGRRNA